MHSIHVFIIHTYKYEKIIYFSVQFYNLLRHTPDTLDHLFIFNYYLDLIISFNLYPGDRYGD